VIRQDRLSAQRGGSGRSGASEVFERDQRECEAIAPRISSAAQEGTQAGAVTALWLGLDRAIRGAAAGAIGDVHVSAGRERLAGLLLGLLALVRRLAASCRIPHARAPEMQMEHFAGRCAVPAALVHGLMLHHRAIDHLCAPVTGAARSKSGVHLGGRIEAKATGGDVSEDPGALFGREWHATSAQRGAASQDHRGLDACSAPIPKAKVPACKG